MARLFGTDGARGVAVTELTCETAMQIGRAAALVLTKHTSHKPKILIGKDTRISSDVLEAALVSGICSVGADAVILGVVPTPAVAMLVRREKADAGVMISASHNSVEFNGIKLFAGNGYKLSDEIEEEIEALILDTPENIKGSLKNGTEIGRISYDKNAATDYIGYIMNAVGGNLNGVNVAIDCANGSASATAEKLFSSMGANVSMINCSPDGTNINDKCGSTHMNELCRFVKENKCDLGVAFDGDADRCLAVDENGTIVDGDKLIAIFANAMNVGGTLKNHTAVVTVMTNIGFKKFAREKNISVETTKVGDRYVLERMQEGGFNLGGEQSGHIIFLDEATTGDGQLSAAKLLSIYAKAGVKMSELAAVMEHYPQVLLNVKIAPEWKNKINGEKKIQRRIEESAARLGDDGRILVRESGTEPLIRVMTEGKNFEVINEIASELAEMIKEIMA